MAFFNFLRLFRHWKPLLLHDIVFKISLDPFDRSFFSLFIFAWVDLDHAAVVDNSTLVQLRFIPISLRRLNWSVIISVIFLSINLLVKIISIDGLSLLNFGIIRLNRAIFYLINMLLSI